MFDIKKILPIEYFGKYLFQLVFTRQIHLSPIILFGNETSLSLQIAFYSYLAATSDRSQLQVTPDQVAGGTLVLGRAQEVAEIVGERVKLETDGIGGERPARQPRPPDRALALFYPLLRRAALIVEGDDPLSRAATGW